jgi:hypothetical protein
MIDQDLQDLLAAWHGADVDDARQLVLLDKLRQNEELRARFAEEVTILSELKTVHYAAPRWLRVSDSLGWGNEEEMETPSVSRMGESEFSALVMERIRSQPPEAPLRQWFGGFGIRYALAAVILLSLVLAYFLIHPSPQGGFIAGKEFPAGNAPIAVLLGAVDVEWEMDNAPSHAGQLLEMGRLKASSGRLSFSFLNGVTVSAEAPLELDLRSVDELVCLRGKLRVQVPLGAEGFVVNSPHCTVVDRGTEFALNVTPDLPTDVMVFDGRADVFMENKKIGGTISTTIGESQAVRVDQDMESPLSIKALPEEFTTMLPAELVPLDIPDSYRDLILASQPWGYWRFQEDSSGMLPNEIDGGPAFRILGDVGFRHHSTGNRSLLFPGDRADPDTLLMLDSPWTPSVENGYAIELWFEAENFSNSTLVALLSSNTTLPHNNHSMVVEVCANKQEMGNIRFLHRWPPGPSLGVNLNSKRIYVPCKWTHLVVQRTGDQLQLFVDGELVNEIVLTTDQLIGPNHVLLGRLLTPEFGAPPNMRRLFRGGMDEVAIYNRPLTPDEIRSRRDAIY